MGVVSSSVEVNVDPERAFRFIADPRNIELVYPESLRFRVLEVPERIGDGSRIRMEARLLGQRFEWYSVIRDYREGKGFTDEAYDSPFLMWRHEHGVRVDGSTNDGSAESDHGSSDGSKGSGRGAYSVGVGSSSSNSNSRCIIDDRIEFKTVLGPIGDLFATRMISSILEYRNHRIRALLEGRSGRVDAVYKDPTVISLGRGAALCIVMTIIGLLIPVYAQGLDIYPLLVANGIAWLLLWFFTHDLLHLIVGMLVGVRFSHFYIGISNLVRALNVSPKYRMLFVALGLKIDRKGSSASKRGYAAMYISGPLASMLIPFYVPSYMLIMNGEHTVASLFLAISIINLVVDAIMSSRHGCIRKGVRALSRP
ncbi:MAG: hypothetical protein RMJ59_06170 [Candidatus Nitrosocaldus sp.]|nr:hypothetical protein [Candidatus Nitrosocaldus sp.]MDW8275947.1 hypothetical protein [Candidatus Nitrosocaldus sp.]